MPGRENHRPIQIESIRIEDTESPPVVFPMHAWENAIQKNSITVTLINRNVLSRLYEASQTLDSLRSYIYEMVFPKQALNPQGVQRASGHKVVRQLCEVRPGTSKSINVHMF